MSESFANTSIQTNIKSKWSHIAEYFVQQSQTSSTDNNLAFKCQILPGYFS